MLRRAKTVLSVLLLGTALGFLHPDIGSAAANTKQAALASVNTTTLDCSFLNGPGSSIAGSVIAGFKCPIITIARASNGTYFDYIGTNQTALTNVPRFDYDSSTLAAKGLLIEEQRTNGIRNPRAEGAVVSGSLPTNWIFNGSGGTVAISVTGTGTEAGISYVDLTIAGTTGGTTQDILFEQPAVISASNAQAWDVSAFIKITAGSLSNVTDVKFFLSQRDNAQTNLGRLDTSTFTPASSGLLSAARQSGAVTTNNASITNLYPALRLDVVNGVAINITLRIGGPQTEAGAFATSLMLPPVASPAAATRAQEFPTMATGLWFNQQKAGTLYAEGDVGAVTQTAVLAILDDGSSTNRIRLGRLSGSALFVDGTTSGSNIPLISGGSNAAGTVAKIAQSWAGFIFTGAQNGASLGTTTNGTFPVGLNRLAFSTQPTSGHLRRVQYWPRSLSASSLQQITQP